VEFLDGQPLNRVPRLRRANWLRYRAGLPRSIDAAGACHRSRRRPRLKVRRRPSRSATCPPSGR